MERKGTSNQELEQLIAAQLKGETSELAEERQPESTERRLDQRISKGGGVGSGTSG